MAQDQDYFKIGKSGFVRLVDIMGNDFSVVQAARVSFQQQSKPEDFDKDRTLARYLMRHEHWTPFEMVETKCGKPNKLEVIEFEKKLKLLQLS
jgi:thymidylate synthase ThyX